MFIKNNILIWTQIIIPVLFLYLALFYLILVVIIYEKGSTSYVIPVYVNECNTKSFLTILICITSISLTRNNNKYNHSKKLNVAASYFCSVDLYVCA
jgi:hypothetical protein